MRKQEKEEEEEQCRSRSIHEILMLVRPYLHSLFEFLSMTGVSRTLRNAIRDETLLWTDFVVEPPLSSRLTDEILWEFTSKSAGKLKTLVLRQCLRITDMGLRRVVDANPLITKIIVPGCTELTPDGIIGCVESLNKNNHKVETVHVNGVCFTKEHLSALMTYLPEEGALDVEVCPICDEVRMIPPCSRGSCNRGEMIERNCKGCWFCIPRCMECAKCLGPDSEIQEAACGGDILCLECWLALPKCRFCNKPYCTSHSSLRLVVGTSDGAGQLMFECQACHFRAGASPYDAFDD